jgi:PST family polysaccharide transporter
VAVTLVAEEPKASDQDGTAAALWGVRRLAANFLLLAGGEGLAKLLTFAAFSYLGRVLGPERYGSLEFVLATVIFFALPVDFGLGIYGARELARDRKWATDLLREVAAMRLVLAGCCYLLLLVAAVMLPGDGEARLLLIVYGLSLFAEPMLLQWFFQGHDRMHWVALANLVRRGVFAVLVLSLLRPGVPLSWVGLCECASAAAMAAFCLFVARRRLGFTLPRPWVRPGVLFRRLRESAPIGLSEFAWALLWYFATVLMGLLAGGEELGWFGASHRVVMALHTFVWLYFFNLLPSLARSAALPGERLGSLVRRSLTVTTWGGVLVAVIFTLFGGKLVALVYGDNFAGAARPLAVLAWIIPAALLSGHYRYTLIACNLQRLEFYCTAGAGVAAAGLGLVLIPGFGAWGAAWALLAAQLVNLALAYYAVRCYVVQIPFLVSLVRPLLAAAAGLVLLRALTG